MSTPRNPNKIWGRWMRVDQQTVSLSTSHSFFLPVLSGKGPSKRIWHPPNNCLWPLLRISSIIWRSLPGSCLGPRNWNWTVAHQFRVQQLSGFYPAVAGGYDNVNDNWRVIPGVDDIVHDCWLIVGYPSSSRANNHLSFSFSILEIEVFTLIFYSFLSSISKVLTALSLDLRSDIETVFPRILGLQTFLFLGSKILSGNTLLGDSFLQDRKGKGEWIWIVVVLSFHLEHQWKPRWQPTINECLPVNRLGERISGNTQETKVNRLLS